MEIVKKTFNNLEDVGLSEAQIVYYIYFPDNKMKFSDVAKDSICRYREGCDLDSVIGLFDKKEQAERVVDKLIADTGNYNYEQPLELFYQIHSAALFEFVNGPFTLNDILYCPEGLFKMEKVQLDPVTRLVFKLYPIDAPVRNVKLSRPTNK